VGEGICTGFWQQELLRKFSDVMSELPGKTDLVDMEIDTGGCQPIAQHPYRPPVSMVKGTKVLDNLLEQGIIVPSKSLWASPMILVKKPNGKVRIYIDFRKLNAKTKPMQYYMPTFEDIKA